MPEQSPQPDNVPVADLLRSEGVEIIEPEEIVEAPTLFNPKVLEVLGISEEETRKAVAYMAAFINGPIFIDRFGTDHGQRRVWIAKMTKEHGITVGNYLDRNKLRVNRLSAIVGFLSLFEYLADHTSPLLEQAKELNNRAEAAYAGYPQKSVREKIETAKQFDLICKDFFKMITDFSVSG